VNRYAVPLPFSLRINKKTLVLFTVALLLIFIAGFRPIGLDRDSPTYVSLLNIPFSQANFLDKEPTFWMLVEINRVLFSSNERTFFLIFAIIGVSLKILAINRLSSMPFLSLWAYICLYFILHEMTQIRAGVASGIFLLAIQDIVNRNFKNYLIKTFLAVMFHYSAIIMLPLYFLNPKRINYALFLTLPILGIILGILTKNEMRYLIEISSEFLPEFIGVKINTYLSLLEMGLFNRLNIIRHYLIAGLLGTYYFLLLNTKYLKFNLDLIMIKILGIMLFLFYSLLAVPVFAGRISEFLGVVLIILIPHIALMFKQKDIIKALIFLYLSGCLILTAKLLNFEVIL